MTQVSIILPVYNVEPYLRQCLDSIINQTFKDFELIVVNDCSPDNSLQIVKEYQQKDSRIVLLNLPKNKGISNARNEGMKIAKAKYIVFIDSDDWVREDYVEVLFNDIEKNNCDVFSEGFALYDNKNSKYIKQRYSPLTTKSKNNKALILFPSMNSTIWNKIYKRDFLLNNDLFFALKSREDCLFFYKLIIANPRIIFKNEPIYFYRIAREKSLTSSLYFKIHNIIILIKEIYKILNKKKIYSEYYKVFLVYTFVYIAYGLTCSPFSTKRTQYVLFSLKRFLFSDNNNFSMSDKFLSSIFKFFLNHARMYRILAIILKATKRFGSKIFYYF